jgi:hypothetical protein
MTDDEWNALSAEERAGRNRYDATVRRCQAKKQQCLQYVSELSGLNTHLSQYKAASIAQPKAPPKYAPEQFTGWQDDERKHDAWEIQLDEWESVLKAAIREAQKALKAAQIKQATEILQRINAAKEDVDVSGVSLGGRQGSRITTAVPSAGVSDSRERLAADVDKVVEVIASLRDPTARENLTNRVINILKLDSLAQAKGDLLTLKTEANTALQAQDCHDLAAQAVLKVAHIDSTEADNLRSKAGVASNSKEVRAIKREVAALLETVKKEEEAQRLQTAIEEVLREMGFEIGEGFEVTDFGSVAVADHADHPGYGVRVQINPDNGMLYTRLVAHGETTPEEDALAEAETCDKIHQMTAGLKKLGVFAELQSERQPGECPLDRAESAKARTTSTKRAHKRRAASRIERSV